MTQPILHEAVELAPAISGRLFEPDAHRRIEQVLVGIEHSIVTGAEQGSCKKAVGHLQVIVRIETRIPRQGSRHIFGKRLRHVRHGRSQCSRVHLPQREGGSGTHPLVGVLEPAGQGGDCAGGFQAAESRAGSIALIDIGGIFRHGDEGVQLSGTYPAGAQFGGGIQPDNWIILAQGGDELLFGIAAANRGEFPGPESVGDRLGAQFLDWI